MSRLVILAIVAIIVLAAVARRPAEPDVGDSFTRGGEPISDLTTVRASSV